MCTTPKQNEGGPIRDFCCRGVSRGRSSKNGLLRHDLIPPRAQTSNPCRGFGPSPPRRPCASFPPGLSSGGFAWEVLKKLASSALRNVISFFRRARTSEPSRGMGPSSPMRPCTMRLASLAVRCHRQHHKLWQQLVVLSFTGRPLPSQSTLHSIVVAAVVRAPCICGLLTTVGGRAGYGKSRTLFRW